MMMMRGAARAAARLLYPKSPRAVAFGQRRPAFIVEGCSTERASRFRIVLFLF